MNKSTLYTNILLSVIAALLGVIAYRGGGTTVVSAGGPTGPLDVNIVSTAKDLPVMISGATKTAPTGPLEVKLVGSTFDLPVVVKNQPEKIVSPAVNPKGVLDVNIVSLGGDALRRVGAQIVLPVGVENTVDTKIVGPMFSGAGTQFKEGVGVVLLNR